MPTRLSFVGGDGSRVGGLVGDGASLHRFLSGNKTLGSAVADQPAQCVILGASSPNGDLTFTMDLGGSWGNSWRVSMTGHPDGSDHPNRELQVFWVNSDMTLLVCFGTDGSGVIEIPTAIQVADKVNAYPEPIATAVFGGDGSGLVRQTLNNNFSNGADSGDAVAMGASLLRVGKVEAL